MAGAMNGQLSGTASNLGKFIELSSTLFMAAKVGKWFAGTLGWVLGGPIGGLIGFGIGYLWDNATMESGTAGQQRSGQSGSTQRGDFGVSLMVLSAAMMKADNKVLKSELAYVKSFLNRQYGQQASAEMLQVLKELLKQDIPVAQVCSQIKSFMTHPQRLQLVHFLAGIANADGEIHELEWKLLKSISRLLNVSEKDLESLSAMYQVDNDRYYRILEIETGATQAQIKAAYRKMAKKYHPDKLGDIGKEAKDAAVEKFRQVQEAYDKLSK
jgi:DnaJ like chaperone protein